MGLLHIKATTVLGEDPRAVEPVVAGAVEADEGVGAIRAAIGDDQVEGIGVDVAGIFAERDFFGVVVVVPGGTKEILVSALDCVGDGFAVGVPVDGLEFFG